MYMIVLYTVSIIVYIYIVSAEFSDVQSIYMHRSDAERSRCGLGMHEAYHHNDMQVVMSLTSVTRY